MSPDQIGPEDRVRVSASLDRHFDRIDVYKIGLRNALGIDLSKARRTARDDGDGIASARFCYLPEVFPFVEPRVRQLRRRQQRAYEAIKERAGESFWKIYADFQPFVESSAHACGIDSDRIAPVLGRTILLFEVSRRTKFVTYLDKSIRESIKNIRGEAYAKQLGIPLSAGRLIPQLRWAIDQATSSAKRAFSPQELDDIVCDFLRRHPSKFSESTMIHIAEVMRRHQDPISLDACRSWLEPSMSSDGSSPGPGNDCHVEHEDACRHELQQIRDAIERAGFDDTEACLVLRRLDLPFDECRFDSLAKAVTSASIRKRSARLLVRLMAAKFAPKAPLFGELLHATSGNAHEEIVAKLSHAAEETGDRYSDLVDGLLNWMSITNSVYRISIVERGRLDNYLTKTNVDTRLSTPTFQKLKAALIEQERIGFPCMRDL